MSARFVIGRAGVGKTHYCLTAVREKLIRSPLDGPRLILLVPEQASLQTEQALLAHDQLVISHRAEVLSFRRIAQRIGGDPALQDRVTLSATGRAMVLRHLLTKLGPDLEYFRNSERFPGFIERLGRTIDELISESVAVSDLHPVLDSPGDDPLRQHKLADLRRIFAAYKEYLGEQRLDPSEYLRAAQDSAPRCEWLRGAEVWVDGFAGFTRQERITLATLAGVTDRMHVTLLMDAKHATLDRMPTTRSELWSKTVRTYVELKRSFTEVGVPIESPVVLNATPPPRFKNSPQLANLESAVFTNQNQWSAKPATAAVHVYKATNRRVEVAYAVAGIAHLVQADESNMRYRDIGIAVRDLDPYHDLIAAALEAAGIPYFIDRRRPTSHHPLVEWIRAFVQLPNDQLAPDTVRLLLKTGLSPLTREESDLVENHLIATELSGVRAWSRPWGTGLGRWTECDRPERQQAAADRLSRLNQAREALLGQVRPWLDFAASEQAHTARAWAEALAEQMRRLEVTAGVERWAESADERGDLDSAEEHRQILHSVSELIAELMEVLPDEPLSPRQLAHVLDSALAQFTLGLAPPTLDQVVVGSVERSRNPELKALFVLGFNDGVFPAAPMEDAILNDDDRAWLASRGLELTPPARELLFEERFLAYVAFTRPSEKLIISYAATTEDGKELRPSPYLDELKAVCPDVERPFVDDPFRARAAWAIRNPSDLAAALANEFNNRPAPTLDRPDLRRFWNTLYQETRHRTALCQTLSALAYENRASLTAGSVARVYPDTLRTSVSRLETFAACPFKHFAEWNIKLEPRQTAQMRPVDIGRLHHAVLEHFILRLLDDQRVFAELTDTELTKRLDDELARLTKELPEAQSVALARDKYMVSRSRTQLERVLRYQRAICALSGFQPAAAELRFGFDDENGLDPLDIDTPAGRRIQLRGIIDRVDLASTENGTLAIVVDYKRTREKRLELHSVYHGLSMQLLAYLLVLRQHGNVSAAKSITPAGALYVSLIEKYDNIEHPDSMMTSEVLPVTGSYRPRGLLNLAHMGTADRTFFESGRSEAYQVALKKDGTLSNVDRSDAADPDDFHRMLERTAWCIGDCADRMLDGVAAVQPYRLGTFSPCGWCDQRAVCRFEFATGGVRNLERLKRTEIFRRLKG